ncbi:MAG: HAD family hydrolase [Micavibrio sp.]|nr:HAD family hydrolase [Micavibrio sp.]
MSLPSTITHFIFDFDGTIADTESVFSHFDCRMLNNAFVRAGISPSLTPTFVQTLAGNNANTKLIMMAEKFGFDAETALPAFVEERGKERKTLFTTSPVPLAKGLKDFVASLNNPSAIATNKRKENLLPDMKVLKLEGLFDILVACDPPMVKKPAPDMLLEAAKQLDAQPENCAYIGDNVLDMQAAEAAGMYPIAMIIEGIEGQEQRIKALKAAGAALIIDDFSTLKPYS